MNANKTALPIATFATAMLLSFAASPGSAQTVGNPPPSTARSAPGVVREGREVDMCQTSGGGTRTRSNCEPEPATLRTEMELKLSIEVPALPSTQCEATANTDYQQRNTIARVASTLKIEHCTAASGSFTVALRLKNDNGEDAPLEFQETWQRSDDADVSFTADYPIGENVELVGVRLRGLRCTCADAAEALPPANE